MVYNYYITITPAHNIKQLLFHDTVSGKTIKMCFKKKLRILSTVIYQMKY